jgi:hypothetical protein
VRFNIAVCHHQLMLAEKPDSLAYEEQRKAALASYQGYLQDMPGASDRADVEAIIVDLGGEPPKGGLKLERIHPDGPSAPPSLHEVPRVEPESGGDSGPPTTGTPPKPAGDPEPRGRVGPFVPLVLAHMGDLSKSDNVAFLPMLGLGIRGAAFLGAKRRVHLGGELALYGMPTATRTKTTLAAGHIAGTVDYALPLGRARRFELAFGGYLGAVVEQLRAREDRALMCQEHDTGVLSTRGGLLLGGRIGLLVLLGKRRNHELALRFGPALTVTSGGTKGEGVTMGSSTCDKTPFAEVGLGGGPGLVTMIDLGYAPRF